MIDFELNTDVETTYIHVFFFTLIYLFVIYINRDLILNENYQFYKPLKWKKRKILLLGLLVLLIAAYTRGDFYHYYDIIKDYDNLGHLEPFYQWLAVSVGSNYLLWRIIVWGSALIILNYTAKRLSVNNVLVSFILFCIFILYYNYARASLAFSVFFFGLTFLIKPWKTKIISYLLGFSIIYSSHFFHSSAYILIALTPVIFVPISRKVFIFSLFLFPFITYILSSFLFGENSILIDFFGGDSMEVRLQHYQEESLSLYRGVSALIHYTLHFGTFFIMTFLIGKEFISRKNIKKEINKFYIFNISLLITALSFATISTSAVFFYRVLYMTIVPLCILFAFSIQNGLITKKTEKICWGIGILCILYECLYSLYLKLLV